MKKLIILLTSFILMGMSDFERREEQNRIQEVMQQTVRVNKKPTPLSDRRAARMQRNRYHNQHHPYFPKTIYREPQQTPKRRRFF